MSNPSTCDAASNARWGDREAVAVRDMTALAQIPRSMVRAPGGEA